MYFVLNKMSYFSVSGPDLPLTFACIGSYYAYKMIECIQNVLEIKKHPVSLKVCSFSVTDCPIFNVD